jgi:hypothetical protein
MSESFRNYSASKYLNNSGQFENESNLDESDLIKMNQELNELINALNKSNSFGQESASRSKTQNILNLDLDLTSQDDYETTTNDENDEHETTTPNEEDMSSPSVRVLDQNSSTMEFRKYLEDLKRNYLEKLTFSCPPKLQPKTLSNKVSMAKPTASTFTAQLTHPNKLKSVENVNARRSLNYNSSLPANFEGFSNVSKENKLNRSSKNLSASSNEFKEAGLNGYATAGSNGLVETPELNKSQILSRLVQIREYLKQAYSMLATLQTSNDLVRIEKNNYF